ncbi:MAG: hypothetical protein M0026_21825 [Nocardiopsaceae bacterium]|nr:hypothetical protein [Nocardiopsaceae bacterium]
MFTASAFSLPCRGDDAVALFTAAQFGLISIVQAYRSGLSPGDVAERLHRGVWMRTPHRNVYRVRGGAHGASPLNRAVMAARLALAPGAFACHETAARLWRLEGLPPWDGRTVHMGVSSRGGALPAGVRAHAVHVADTDLVWRAPFLLTGVVRTLHDMAGSVEPRTFSRLLDSAVSRGLVAPGAVAGRGT